MNGKSMNERDIFMNGPEDPSPEELKRYIDEACGDNPILRKKVEALYAAVTDATSFMDTPPQVIEERPPTGESEGSVI